MRHRVKGAKLNRDQAGRQSLQRNLLKSFVRSGKLETTLAKAKFIAPEIEKLVTKSRPADLNARRRLYRVLADKKLVDHFLEKVVPVFKDRPGGYTRLIRLGPRLGDAAELARVEWVEKVTGVEEKKISKLKKAKVPSKK